MYQVKVLRDGQVVCVAHVDELMPAHEWAYIEMRIRRAVDSQPRWAALVTSGWLMHDPYTGKPDTFIQDNKSRDGLVLDKRMLTDPEIDLQTLFGLRKPTD